MIPAQFNSSAGDYGCFVPSPGTGQYDLYTDSTSYAASYKVGSANQLPSSDDQVTINKVVSENTVISKDGVPYRLKIWGFYNNGTTQTCPSTPQGSQDETVTYFRTKEGQDTFGCLYGEFQQERYVTISKKVVADAHSQNVSVPAFSFHTDADAAADYFYSQGVVSDTSLFTSGVISGEHAGFINDGAFANTLRPTSAADPGGNRRLRPGRRHPVTHRRVLCLRRRVQWFPDHREQSRHLGEPHEIGVKTRVHLVRERAGRRCRGGYRPERRQCRLLPRRRSQ